MSGSHPTVIPDEWLDAEGWIFGCENWMAFPTDEHLTQLDRDAWNLRWHLHKLTQPQLGELDMDPARPFVLRWGKDRDGWQRRYILCSGATLDDVLDEANAYMQTIVDGWMADEPARRERIKARAKAWLDVNDPERLFKTLSPVDGREGSL